MVSYRIHSTVKIKKFLKIIIVKVLGKSATGAVCFPLTSFWLLMREVKICSSQMTWYYRFTSPPIRKPFTTHKAKYQDLLNKRSKATFMACSDKIFFLVKFVLCSGWKRSSTFMFCLTQRSGTFHTSSTQQHWWFYAKNLLCTEK